MSVLDPWSWFPLLLTSFPPAQNTKEEGMKEGERTGPALPPLTGSMCFNAGLLLLLRPFASTLSGLGWWKSSGGDKERRKRQGGPIRGEGRGQDPVGGVRHAGQLLCHGDSGEGEERRRRSRRKDGGTLLCRKQLISRVHPSACSRSSRFSTARSQLLPKYSVRRFPPAKQS